VGNTESLSGSPLAQGGVYENGAASHLGGRSGELPFVYTPGQLTKPVTNQTEKSVIKLNPKV